MKRFLLGLLKILPIILLVGTVSEYVTAWVFGVIAALIGAAGRWDCWHEWVRVKGTAHITTETVENLCLEACRHCGKTRLREDDLPDSDDDGGIAVEVPDDDDDDGEEWKGGEHV
jgi:hypothetical protein